MYHVGTALMDQFENVSSPVNLFWPGYPMVLRTLLKNLPREL